ncbi:MAG TPA: DUF1552 domain-containing protein [Polyangiaceae bacterium]|jgi:hypothetical protein|nr:DUF1552 domain-containing protein [Polyangiaceae bacterium]
MRQTMLSRRRLLRGVLGGAVIAIGLPPLEAMFNAHGTAYAGGAAIPKRLGIFFWGNGVKLDRWVPATTGAGWTPSPALDPLAALKDNVSVVSGMNIKTGNERGHHAGCVGILSGAPMVSQPHPNSGYASTFSKPSIDQIAAAAISQGTRFRSLEVGVSRRTVSGEGTTLHYLSHNGPDSFNPPEYDPAKVFDRLFGTGFVPPSSGTPPVDPSLALRRSVLDAVSTDVADLKSRVGAVDRVRLDQHLTNIRSIESRLTQIPPPPPPTLSCKLPVKPGSFPDMSGKEAIEERMKAMSDLIAMAFACDQTRVFSLMFSGSVGSTVFWQVGATSGHHDLTHNEAGNQPMVHDTTVFTMKQFATLLAALKAIPEGAGNLLDSCAILASSDVADGLAHSINNYPILVAGGAGGALKYPGVHYKSAGENTSMVLFSLLKAVGLPLTEFGDGGGRVTTSCTAIEV